MLYPSPKSGNYRHQDDIEFHNEGACRNNRRGSTEYPCIRQGTSERRPVRPGMQSGTFPRGPEGCEGVRLNDRQEEVGSPD